MYLVYKLISIVIYYFVSLTIRDDLERNIFVPSYSAV